MGKEIFFKKDLPTVLDNVQAAQSTIDSEVDDIVAEVTTKGMIAMQLAMGDGSGKHHEKVLKEAKQLITNLIAQEANKALLSAEYWKPYDALYDVSTLGRVRRGGKILKQSQRPKGYYGVTLSMGNEQKSINVHRMVASTFLPNPENKRCVNHIDGNGLNNVITNLEWATHSENQEHSFRVLGNTIWNKGRMDIAAHLPRSAKSQPFQYALYSGKHLIGTGTAKELAKVIGKRPAYIRYLATPTRQHRLLKAHRPSEAMYAVKLGLQLTADKEQK